MKSDILNLHKTEYGYDQFIVAISDNINLFFDQKIKQLGFTHIWDDDDIALKVVNESNIKGYSKKITCCDINYSLFFKTTNVEKSREKALEVLSEFKLVFEKLGFYLHEFTSFDENKFFLITYIDQIYVPIIALIEDKIVKIELTNLLNIFIRSLPLSFNPYKFAYIVQNQNRTEIIKKIKQLDEFKGYKVLNNDNINEQLKEANSLQLAILLTVSISLIEAKKYRVVIGNDLVNYKEISSDDLSDFLSEKEEYLSKKNYKESMKKTINFLSLNLVDNCYICDNCISIQKQKLFLKYFVQNGNDKCCFCNKNIGKKYLIVDKE